VLFLLIIAAQVYLPDGTAKEAIVSVLLSVLAVLIVSLVWDVLMRQAWTDELLTLVKLERGLKTAGIRGVGQESDIAWKDFLDGMDELHFIVRDLDLWLNTRFAQVITTAGGDRPLRLHLYIPDPRQVESGEYPTLTTPAYDRSRSRLETEWDTAIAERRLHVRSRLDKWALRTPPQFMIVSARRGSRHRNLLVLWPTQGGGLASPPVSLRFETSQGDGAEVAEWVEGQLGPLRVEPNRVVL
jgi:hypothetical protein